jgi:hypothetical protein
MSANSLVASSTASWTDADQVWVDGVTDAALQIVRLRYVKLPGNVTTFGAGTLYLALFWDQPGYTQGHGLGMVGTNATGASFFYTDVYGTFTNNSSQSAPQILATASPTATAFYSNTGTPVVGLEATVYAWCMVAGGGSGINVSLPTFGPPPSSLVTPVVASSPQLPVVPTPPPSASPRSSLAPSGLASAPVVVVIPNASLVLAPTVSTPSPTNGTNGTNGTVFTPIDDSSAPTSGPGIDFNVAIWVLLALLALLVLVVLVLIVFIIRRRRHDMEAQRLTDLMRSQGLYVDEGGDDSHQVELDGLPKRSTADLSEDEDEQHDPKSPLVPVGDTPTPAGLVTPTGLKGPTALDTPKSILTEVKL